MHLLAPFATTPDSGLSHCDIVARYAENRFVLTFRGKLGEHDLLYSHRCIIRAAVFQGDTGILCDLRAVEFWGLSAAFLAEMAELPGLSPRNRRAFVARPGLGHGILHFLRLRAPRGQVHIFHDYGEAEQWLATADRPNHRTA